jgi:hypothetical protein
MGKNIKNGFDEVEIIQRRDSAVDARFVRPLNARGRRALADARLLALALTLPTGPDAGKASRGVHDDPDDTEILAYLLDELSDTRRNELERSVRGNARAIGRLMKLRTALNPVADKRGLHRTELAARNILRRMGQALEVREAGKKLEFRERHPQLRPGPKTGAMLNDLLDRASTPILGGDLGKETKLLLARWEELARSEKHPQAYDGTDSEFQQVGMRLAEVVLDLEEASTQLARAIRRTIFDIVDAVPPRDLPIRTATAASKGGAPLFQGKLPGLGAPEDSLSDWSGTKEIQAGAWSLLLEGIATPSPMLSVTIRSSGTDGMPDLTLVQANRGFETTNVSAAGIASIRLPVGDSMLLAQGDKEVWQIPLTLLRGK